MNVSTDPLPRPAGINLTQLMLRKWLTEESACSADRRDKAVMRFACSTDFIRSAGQRTAQG
jgi:hypothetical protein